MGPPSQAMPSFALPSLNNSSSMLNASYGHSEVNEELIPTAIVIKNIPFLVKKEQLVRVIVDLGLPLGAWPLRNSLPPKRRPPSSTRWTTSS
jgi:hypothetical protein